jgi:hypothetical protein
MQRPPFGFSKQGVIRRGSFDRWQMTENDSNESFKPDAANTRSLAQRSVIGPQSGRSIAPDSGAAAGKGAAFLTIFIFLLLGSIDSRRRSVGLFCSRTGWHERVEDRGP